MLQRERLYCLCKGRRLASLQEQRPLSTTSTSTHGDSRVLAGALVWLRVSVCKGVNI